MKPLQLKEALGYCIDSGRPAFVWGDPGTGKSSIVGQVAGDTGRRLIDERIVTKDIVDFGIPKIEGDKHFFTIPDFLPNGDGPSILFFDEFPQAFPAVQNCLSEIILDGRLRDRWQKPDNCAIVAAGNLESNRAATHKMPSHIKNRFIHLTLETDLEQWIQYALGAGFHTDVIFFMKHRGNELLFQFDPSRDDEKAYPTPRSWEFASDILKTNPPKDILFDLLAGTVGSAAGSEFYGFLDIKDKLVLPDQILLNPDTADIPEDTAAMFAICGALAAKATDQTLDRIVRYAQRLKPEFNVFMMTSIFTKDKELMNTRTYASWHADNQEVLI